MAAPDLIQEVKPRKKARFAIEEWIAKANECVTFHLVGSAEQWADGSARSGKGFRPAYTHQVFSEEEEIKGYKDLKIDIFINSRDFTTMAEVSFSDKSSTADDVDSMLAECFETGFLQGAESTATFQSKLEESDRLSAQDYGKEVSRSLLAGGSELILTCANVSSASERLKGIHAQLQPLLLFFIDGASCIDQDDRDWDVLFALKKDGQHVSVTGFCTLHRFFAYPESHRLQLSQILVLEPYRRQGIASRLMEAVMQLAHSGNAQDVTYEDPTPDVERLREAIDLRACLATSWLPSAAAEAVAACSALTDPKAKETALCPGHEVLNRAQKDLKLSKTWFKRVWECLLMPHVKAHGDLLLPSLIGYIKGRLGAGDGDATGNEGKRTWETETGFVMAQVNGDIGVAPVLEDPEMSEAERAEQVAEVVGERLQEIQAICTMSDSK